MTYLPVKDLPSGYNSGEQYDTMSTVVVPENSLLMQTENRETSSSSSIPKKMDLAADLDRITLHKLQMVNKSVSSHVSVLIEKSPLGHDVKSKIPGNVLYNCSDTDTTSCFDSDRTYMRSECQSTHLEDESLLWREERKETRKNLTSSKRWHRGEHGTLKRKVRRPC